MAETNPPKVDDEQAWAKWLEMAPLLDRMIERIGTPGEFQVGSNSSLAADDAASDPYHVSHVVRLCLNAGVDHLHAAKVLVVDQQAVHLAAPASLAKGALETLSAAFWVLNPEAGEERVTRALRWHAKNMKDGETATKQLSLPGYVPLETKLSKLDAVAIRHGLDTREIRDGYSSTETLVYTQAEAKDLPMGVVFAWRVCSGFAHGRPWAYLGVSELEGSEPDAAGIINIKMTSSATRGAISVVGRHATS